MLPLEKSVFRALSVQFDSPIPSGNTPRFKRGLHLGSTYVLCTVPLALFIC